MVSAKGRRLMVGAAAVVANLGWLQLAPAFGYPVTAPAGMLDRMLGASRETGPAGWVMLLLGHAAFAALAFVIVERRARVALASLAFAVGAWLISGAVLMPLIGFIQGAPPPGAVASDPMQATFFMLNLGLGAAAEALVGWLLFGAVIAAGTTLKISARAFGLAVGAAALAASVALAAPALAVRDSGQVYEGRIAALPAAPVFISVLELPQPAGAVLGPHTHIPGFVLDTSGTATMVIDGSVVDVGAGGAFFTANLQPHDHENRAAIPYAVGGAVVVVGLVLALLLFQGRGPSAALMAALLVAGTVATVNPLMNHWYFIGVRPAAQRGAAMPVPAGHRTYESENLTGLASGPYLEQLTHRRLGAGDSVRVVGPAAIVLVDGQALITADGRTSNVSAQSGATIAGGVEMELRVESGSARVLIVRLSPAG